MTVNETFQARLMFLDGCFLFANPKSFSRRYKIILNNKTGRNPEKNKRSIDQLSFARVKSTRKNIDTEVRLQF